MARFEGQFHFLSATNVAITVVILEWHHLHTDELTAIGLDQTFCDFLNFRGGQCDPSVSKEMLAAIFFFT